MKPIGLTFKWEGVDKYNNLREGELMLIHECTGCGKISINRIAADDNEETILKVFDESQKLPLQKRAELQRKKHRHSFFRSKREGHYSTFWQD